MSITKILRATFSMHFYHSRLYSYTKNNNNLDVERLVEMSYLYTLNYMWCQIKLSMNPSIA